MLIRHVGRWLCILGIASGAAGAVASCGSGGDNSTFTGGPQDAAVGDGSIGKPTEGGTFFNDSGTGNGCKPKTCQEQGFTCGDNADGCGNILHCGTCMAPDYCGGGGYSKCGGAAVGPDGGPIMVCTPFTCATSPNGPYTCGKTGDGCGGTIDCGTCSNPTFCGGGGFNKCGGNNGLQPDGGVPCVPATACPANQNCGQASDGCGGLIACGTCPANQYCGGGGPSQCGGSTGLNPDGGVPCTPATTCPASQNCGQAADGCGGLINCGQCTSPAYCGGGGPSQCGGNNGMTPDGSVVCTPTTCAKLGNPCGQQSDGCGGVLSCTQCVLPQTCGGGGVPNQCGGNNGVSPDGGLLCTAKTCASFPAGTCGKQADGCGGVTAYCGACVAPDTCGGGGVASQCGNSNLLPDGGNPCTPKTTCPGGITCGQAADGCGGVINCGTCVSPQICGGGGVAGQCGHTGLASDGGVLCTPKTCATAPGGPYNCGVVGDGCGGLTTSCGSCVSPEYCGGGGPQVCGPTSIAQCDSGSTSLSGYVFDPANNLPVYNALVYVPVGAVQAPQTGVVPAQCGCTAPPAYASAYTGIDGKFTLANPPSGTTTVVVQLGKWQRTFSKPITKCTANNLGGGTAGSASNLTLPSDHTQGNIPLFAIDTGAVDTMECVLLKMGIAQSEFVDPGITAGKPNPTKRVHLYQGSIVNGGAIIDNNTPTESALTEAASVMDAYDVILFPCQGGAGNYASGAWPNTLGNLLNYTAAGGRAFTTHFHYDLLDGNGSFSGTANWNLGNGSWGNLYGDTKYPSVIDQSFARGATLASWLAQPIVYGLTPGQIPVGVIRNDFSSVNAPAQRWMYTANDVNVGGTGQGPGANIPLHYTFDTPFNQSPTCGRVVYSDFHVESEQTNNGANGVTFPNECPTGAMTPQEKLLEFMLFDLTSCVSPPTCTPLTCANFPSTTCGVQGDGCGGQTAFCNPCTAPNTCGGGGVANQCGYPDAGCTPLTCASFPGTTCGEQGDGCGGHTAFCNPCTAPATCGGGGVSGQCGYPGTTCTPATCTSLGLQCGYGSDGCGSVTASCGTCPAGSGCKNNMCVPIDAGSACVPETCGQLGVACGLADDGCGNLLTCPSCPSGQTCVFNQCVAADGGACTPLTCSSFPSTTCGEQSDGCGSHTAFCNPCTPPATCGGGGVANQCGYPEAGTCTPLTCSSFPSTTCGPQADGCGGVTAFCNPCTAPATCGGGGVAGQCGLPDAGSCVPETCKQQNIGCGPAGDGCGNVIQCGPCTAPATCGGGGTPSQCGVLDAGSCVPLTCASQHVSCGPLGDGCGNLLQCGSCTGTQTCGGGGTPGVCGGGSQ